LTAWDNIREYPTISYNEDVISNVFLSPDDLIYRTRWYIYLRWFILVAIILPGLVSLYIGEGLSSNLRMNALLGLTALGANVIFFILGRLLKNTSVIKVLVTSIFLIDILLITYFIYTNGGIDSRSVILYVIPLIMSAAIFGRKGVYTLALLSVLAYDMLLLCNYLGIFYSVGDIRPQVDYAYVVNSVIFFNVLFILISMAVDFIARLLVHKERQATHHLDELMRAQSIARFGSWEWRVGDDVVSWSDELYHIFDVEKTATPITFERYLSLIHPDDHELVLREINKATKKGRAFSFSHRLLTEEGTVRYIQSNGQSYVDKHGTVTHMVGAAHDITESKLLESAKNDFVAVTSHQLRTPATIVKQYVTLLQEGYVGELSNEQQAYLQTIYDSNERQINIINDLLNVARIDSGHFNIDTQKTDVVAMIAKIKREHIEKYKAKGQRLIFKTEYKSVYCEIDAEQIRMAIENLLDNAHKYTPAKKTVKVVLKRRRSFLEIAIHDEGIGIPAKDIHKIFEMFSRVDNPSAFQEEGTGIGLYWAKKMVSLHGGTIEVVSTEGRGTVFIITLPYKQNKK
jgi:signal transduction histidine kinase